MNVRDPVESRVLAAGYNQVKGLRRILPIEKAEQMTLPQAILFVREQDARMARAWGRVIDSLEV